MCKTYVRFSVESSVEPCGIPGVELFWRIIENYIWIDHEIPKGPVPKNWENKTLEAKLLKTIKGLLKNY